MKTSYLFPHRFRTISGVLFAIAFMALIIFIAFNNPAGDEFSMPVFAIIGNDGFIGDTFFFRIIKNTAVDEILVLLVLVSGIVFAFAKEKHEDEMVSSIRLHSLAWSTIANYAILLLCYTFIYGLPFFNILMGAMFSQLIIFIVLFRYKMYRFYTDSHDEE